MWRRVRTQPNTVSPGETVVPADSARKNTPLAAVPTTPVVRALDNGGKGLPGKAFVAYVYVRSRVSDDCLRDGIVLSSTDLDQPFDHPCATQSLRTFAKDHVRLAVREGDGVNHFTGKAGYLSMPLAYATLDAAWLAAEGRAAIAAGQVSIVITDHAHAVWSLPSPPISFAVVPLANSPCVELQLASDLSRYALGTALSSPRRPSVLAGMSVKGLEQDTNLPYAFLFSSAESWLMPPTLPLASTDIGADDPFAASCALDPRCDASYCNGATGTDLRDCIAHAYVTATGHYPAISLRAVDDSGNGVPNLRVRLRSLQQAVQPELPRTTEIISCGLVTREEYDLYGAEAASAALGTSTMDGGALHARNRMHVSPFARNRMHISPFVRQSRCAGRDAPPHMFACRRRRVCAAF